jgi:hypothetical protein
MAATNIAAAGLSPAMKQRIPGYARNPEQMAFFHVVPSETGISRTIWVSQSEAYPALLLSPAPGRMIDPPADALVVSFDETTPYADVNDWLADNHHLLPALARQEIDVGEFYDGMKRHRPA